MACRDNDDSALNIFTVCIVSRRPRHRKKKTNILEGKRSGEESTGASLPKVAAVEIR
jgi:hypothetical protein